MLVRFLLAVVLAAGTATAQMIGGMSFPSSAGSATSTATSPATPATPYSFPGGPAANDLIFGTGVTRFPNNANPSITIPVRPLPPDHGYRFPYLQPRSYTPIESANDLVRRAPSVELPHSLLPPETPKTREWDVIRSDYALAAVRVSAARQFVDELHARQEEQGLTTDPNLLTTTTDAEKALQSAREAMAAQNVDNSREPIRQAIGLADVVLRQFGR